MSTEHRAITLLREYDEAKAHLRRLEDKLNQDCADYGRTILGLWGFSPCHLRQRLHALGLTKKEQTNG